MLCYSAYVAESAVGFMPDPVASPTYAAINYARAIANQIYFHGLSSVPDALSAMIGSKPKIEQVFHLFDNSSVPESGSGLLGGLPNDYFINPRNKSNYNPDPSLQRVPFYEPVRT